MAIVELIKTFIHIDNYLISIIQEYGIWIYPILFLIIFLETGVVLFPFLPGDSLLFAVGTIAAVGELNILLLFVLIVAAAIIGDSVNYFIGLKFGRKILTNKVKIINEERLKKVEKFYEEHGEKTIFLVRFFPILRTFAPFVAGVAKMNYQIFFFYNVFGGFVWVLVFLLGGYFFGNIPLVKNNFSIFIIIIIVLSIIPFIYKYLKKKLSKNY